MLLSWIYFKQNISKWIFKSLSVSRGKWNPNNKKIHYTVVKLTSKLKTQLNNPRWKVSTWRLLVDLTLKLLNNLSQYSQLTIQYIKSDELFTNVHCQGLPQKGVQLFAVKDSPTFKETRWIPSVLTVSSVKVRLTIPLPVVLLNLVQQKVARVSCRISLAISWITMYSILNPGWMRVDKRP